MIKFTHKGNFKNTERFLSRAKRFQVLDIMHRYGERGVRALSAATPKDTGLTASSWEYKVQQTSSGKWSLTWFNTNIQNGAPIAILLQYGHGTRGGTFVSGIDYINPAMKPILDELSDSIWKEVSKL